MSTNESPLPLRSAEEILAKTGFSQMYYNDIIVKAINEFHDQFKDQSQEQIIEELKEEIESLKSCLRDPYIAIIKLNEVKGFLNGLIQANFIQGMGATVMIKRAKDLLKSVAETIQSHAQFQQQSPLVSALEKILSIANGMYDTKDSNAIYKIATQTLSNYKNGNENKQRKSN